MLTFAPTAAAGSDLGTAVDQLPFNLLILDGDLRVTYANAAAVVFPDAPRPAEILGVSALDLPPMNALPREVYLRALEGCRHHDEAVEYRSAAGAVHFEFDVRPLKAADHVVGLAVLYAPAGDRGMLRTLQGASKQHLEMLTENARDIISIVGADGRLVYVSGGLPNALGYAFEERHLRSIFDIAHPDDATVLKTRFAQLTSGETRRFSMEYRVRHKDGRYRWL